MQRKSLVAQRRAAVALCIVLLTLAQQVCAGPLASRLRSISDLAADPRGGQAVQAPRRTARMTPLWRVLNTKPYGAYCQSNYECSTGICRFGHCSTSHRSPSKPVHH